MCASTLCPFSSSTRNIALGRLSRIVPSSTMASLLGLGRTELLDVATLVVADTGSEASRTRQPGQGRGAMLSARTPRAKCHDQARCAPCGRTDGAYRSNSELHDPGFHRVRHGVGAVAEVQAGGHVVDHVLDRALRVG